MRTGISIVSLLLLMVLSGMQCSQPVQTTEGGGTETVIGYIHNSDGSGVTGAEVTIIPENYNPVADDAYRIQ